MDEAEIEDRVYNVKAIPGDKFGIPHDQAGWFYRAKIDRVSVGPHDTRGQAIDAMIEDDKKVAYGRG